MLIGSDGDVSVGVVLDDDGLLFARTSRSSLLLLTLTSVYALSRHSVHLSGLVVGCVLLESALYLRVVLSRDRFEEGRNAGRHGDDSSGGEG